VRGELEGWGDTELGARLTFGGTLAAGLKKMGKKPVARACEKKNSSEPEGWRAPKKNKRVTGG